MVIRSRAVVAGLFIALPLCAAVVACTAGEDVAYDKAGLGTTDGGDGGGDGGTPKIIVPSDATIPPRVDDGGTFEAAAPFDCPAGLESDPEAFTGCLASAGLGCCLGTTSLDNKCHERIEVDRGGACKGAKDAFVTCMGSNTDSTCCWYRADAGGLGTAFRGDCDGGAVVAEACEPDGGTCTGNLPCVTATCGGVTVGACGVTPPCQ